MASVHVPRWTRSAPWHQGTKTALFLPPDCSANVAILLNAHANRDVHAVEREVAEGLWSQCEGLARKRRIPLGDDGGGIAQRDGFKQF